MNLLTVIVLIIFILCMLRGYRKGFVKSLVSMVSLVVSLVLVAFVSPYVMNFLKTQTPVYDMVREKCKETFYIENVVTEKDEATMVASSDIQSQLIEDLPVPAMFKNMLKENNTPEKYKELAVSSFNEYVPEFMTNLFMNMISFVVTWVMVIAVIGIAVMILDMITSLPLIRGVNQILGLGFGVVQATIIVWIGMLVITIFSNTQAGRLMMEMISESQILKTLYQSNLILEFLQSTVKVFL